MGCLRKPAQWDTYPVGALQKNSSWMLSGSRKVTMAFRVYPGSLTPECGIPEPVQSLRPVVEVFSSINQELQVIEPRTELAELFAGVLQVTDEGEDELAFRLHQSDVMQLTIFTCIVVKHLEAQEL